MPKRRSAAEPQPKRLVGAGLAPALVPHHGRTTRAGQAQAPTRRLSCLLKKKNPRYCHVELFFFGNNYSDAVRRLPTAVRTTLFPRVGSSLVQESNGLNGILAHRDVDAPVRVDPNGLLILFQDIRRHGAHKALRTPEGHARVPAVGFITA